jgi:hypothetical protein
MAQRGNVETKAVAKPRAKKAAAVPQVVGVKGFDADLKCLGYQFEVGKTYEHSGPIRMCASGFHFIEGNPLDVLDFYPLIGDDGRPNRFASVVAHGEVTRDGSAKSVTGKITVSAELKVPDFIASAIKFEIDACKDKAGENVQATSGDSSKLAASGNYSQLAASGDSSQLAASGKNSVITASAPGCTACGADGTWISLAEFERNGKCIGFATGCIGKNGLKPDTAYYAKDGKLVEVGQ